MGIIAYVVLYALMLQKGYQESKVEKLGGQTGEVLCMQLFPIMPFQKDPPSNRCTTLYIHKFESYVAHILPRPCTAICQCVSYFVSIRRGLLTQGGGKREAGRGDGTKTLKARPAPAP